MLPEKLVIEAFGPYLTRQTVDFTQFAERFLIWGETGAGKTVLLDAMTAALYNRASAEERGDMESMRCQLAEPERDSYVEFTFSVRGRRVRFWKRLRTVKRRKADAEERVKLECGVLEIRQDGTERSLMQSDKAREQERVAEEIVGMGYHQFVQVMVLPQGKFERFLTADSAEKEKILKNIFRTDCYNAYQESLNRSYRAFDAQVREQEQAYNAQLKVYDAENTQQLRWQLVQDEAELDALKQENEDKKRQYDECNAQAIAAQQLEERFARWESGEQALNDLLQREKGVQDCERDVARAEQARGIHPFAAEYDRLAKEQQNRMSDRDYAASEAARAAEEMQAAAQEQKTCEALHEETEQMQRELAQAEMRLPELVALDAAVRAQQEAERLMQPVQRQVWQLEENVCDQREKLIAIRDERQALETQFRARLAQLQETCAAYARAGQYAQQISALEEQLSRAQSAREEAQRQRDEVSFQVNIAMQEEAERQAQYFSNAASELAKRLEEGKPCPVCGSIYHPNVHQSAAYADARQKLQQAMRNLKQMRENLTRAAARYEGAQERLRSVREQLTNARKDATEQIAYDAQAERVAQMQLKQAQEGIKRSDALAEEQKQYEQRLSRLESELKRAQDEFVQQQERVTQARTRVQETQKRVGEIEQTVAQLQQHITQLRGRITQYKERQQRAEAREHVASAQLMLKNTLLENASSQLGQAEEECAQALDALQKALAQQGFDGVEEYHACVRDEEEIARMRAQVQSYQQALAAAKSERDAALRDVAGKQRPDLAGVQRECEESLARVKDAAMRLGTQEALVQGKRALLQYAQHEEESLEQKKRTRDKMRAFAESFTYAKGVTLSSFVLSAMLSSVAAQANQLLTLVHGGRYRLVIKKATTRARLDGLELAVMDAYTGQERDVRTLSGGEKFLVSLSLSLGLSAVVRAQAGGISMEAMFIDEGFGTLDPRSIKDALDVLTCIGTGSRVGIISHVDVLRENILQGIEVVKREKGSLILMRT